MIKLIRPNFWRSINILSLALYPLSLLYRIISFILLKSCKTRKLDIPVICIGNVTVGGAGKTPLAIALGKHLQTKGIKVAYLTRGFGGDGTITMVNNHNHHQVGDEALLLAKIAPTYVGANRYITGQMAQNDGAKVIIMDDGMQHHKLHKDITVMVVDGDYEFGNGMTLPAGPLRQTINSSLIQATAVVYMNKMPLKKLTDKPLFMMKYIVNNSMQLQGKSFIGLCSIASPEKFSKTVQQCGATLLELCAFPDHHPYKDKELIQVINKADKAGCQVLTTTKDMVKIPSTLQKNIVTMDIDLYDCTALSDYIIKTLQL